MLSVVHGKEPKLNVYELLEAVFCNHEAKRHLVIEFRT